MLSIVFGYAYPNFYLVRGDPLQIFGFAVGHMVIAVALVAFVIPRSMNLFVPTERRPEGIRGYAPQTVLGLDDTNIMAGVEIKDTEMGPSPVDSNEDTKKSKEAKEI